MQRTDNRYWICIIEFNYHYEEYYGFGLCSETEAEERIEEILKECDEDCLGYEIKEVSEEYNSKMFTAYELQEAYNLLETKYHNEFVKQLKKDMEQLKKELDIPIYASIIE